MTNDKTQKIYVQELHFEFQQSKAMLPLIVIYLQREVSLAQGLLNAHVVFSFFLILSGEEHVRSFIETF